MRCCCLVTALAGISLALTAPTLRYRKPNDGDSDIHFVFSSDCKPYQSWQVIALWKSAQAVGQKGVFTRIASGCEKGGQPWIDGAKQVRPRRIKPFCATACPNVRLLCGRS